MKQTTSLSVCLFAATLLLMIVFANAKPAFGQAPTATPLLTSTAPVVPSIVPTSAIQGDLVLTQAQQAVNTANTLINVAAIVLAIIGVIGVVLGAMTFFGIRDSRARIQEMENVKGSTEKKLEELNQVFQQNTDLARKVNARLEELEAVRQQSEDTLEAVQSTSINTVQTNAFLHLGTTQASSGNVKTALSTLEKAFELDPHNQATIYSLAEVYIQIGEPDKGVDYLKPLIAGGEALPMIEAAYANALRLCGNKVEEINRNLYYSEAESRFLKVLKNDPYLANVYGIPVTELLGEIYQAQNRVEEAINSYMQAAVQNQNRTHALLKIGILKLRKGEITEAQEHFGSVNRMAGEYLKTHFQDDVAYCDLVTARFGLNWTDQAMQGLKLIKQNFPTPIVLERFCNDLVALQSTPHAPDKIDEAIRSVQKAIDDIKHPASQDHTEQGNQAIP